MSAIPIQPLSITTIMSSRLIVVFLLIWSSLINVQGATGPICSPNVIGCCCQTANTLTRTQFKTVIRTSTKNVVTPTVTVTSTFSLPPSYSTCGVCSVENGPCCLKVSKTLTTTVSSVSTKLVIVSSRKATQSIVPVTVTTTLTLKPTSQKLTTPKSTQKSTQKSSVKSSAKSTHRPSFVSLPIVTKTSIIGKSTRTYQTFVTKSTRTIQFDGKPTSISCTQPSGVAVALASGIRANVVLTIPKNIQPPWTCTIPQDVSITVPAAVLNAGNATTFKQPLVWDLKGPIKILANHTVMGLGLVTFSQEGDRNLTSLVNFIRIPAPALSIRNKILPNWQQTLILRPSLSYVRGNIEFVFRAISPSVLDTTIFPKAIPSLFGATTLQLALNKLTGRSVKDGIVGFILKGNLAQLVPSDNRDNIQVTVSAFLSQLPQASLAGRFVSTMSGVIGSLTGKTVGGYLVSLPGMTLAFNGTDVKPASISLQNACKIKSTPAFAYLYNLPRLTLPVTGLQTNANISLACQGNSVTVQARANAYSNRFLWGQNGRKVQADLTIDEVIGTGVSDVVDIHNGTLTYNSKSGLTLSAIVFGLSPRLGKTEKPLLAKAKPGVVNKAPPKAKKDLQEAIVGYETIAFNMTISMEQFQFSGVSLVSIPKVIPGVVKGKSTSRKLHLPIHIGQPLNVDCKTHIKRGRIIKGRINLLPCSQDTKSLNKSLGLLHHHIPIGNSLNALLNRASGKSQFFSEILIVNTTLRYIPGSVSISGKSLVAGIHSPVSLNLTLTKQRIVSERASVLYNPQVVLAKGNKVNAGNVTIALSDHPCVTKVTHSASFAMPQVPQRKMQQLVGQKWKTVSLMNPASFVGDKAGVNFTCNSVYGNVQHLAVSGGLNQKSVQTSLFDGTNTMLSNMILDYNTMYGDHVIVRSYYDMTERAAGQASQVYLFFPMSINAATTPTNPLPFWEVHTLKNAGFLNSSIQALLGKGHPSALQFQSTFHKTDSLLIKKALNQPALAKNVSYGFYRQTNQHGSTHAVHELFFFGRTAFDRLRNREIHVGQRVSNLTGVQVQRHQPQGYKPWPNTKPSVRTPTVASRPSPYKSAYDPGAPKLLSTTSRSKTSKKSTVVKTSVKSSIKSIAKSSIKSSTKSSLKSTVKSSLKTTTVKTSQKTSLKKTTTTKKLQKRQTTGNAVTVTTQTFVGPTYASTALASGILPVSSNAFAYSFQIGPNANAQLNLDFQSGYQVCPPQEQSLNAQIVNSPMFKNVEGLSGRATFICNDNETEPVSFAAQLASQDLTLTPFTTGIPLNNVSIQVNCIPDSNLCFWPSNMQGSGLYSWANALNSSSYWSSLNVMDMLSNSQIGGPNAQLLNSTLQNYPSLLSNIQAVQQNLLPQFLLADPLGASLIGELDFNLPIQSFQCSSTFQSSCEWPSLVVGASMKTNPAGPTASGDISQITSNLMYGAVLQTSASGIKVQQQEVAGNLGGYGYFAVNVTQDLCSGQVENVIYEINNLPGGVSLNGNPPGVLFSSTGQVVLDCTTLHSGVIGSWTFIDSFTNPLSMSVPILGNNVSITINQPSQPVWLTYSSGNDSLGLNAYLSGFYFGVNFRLQDPSTTLHVTIYSGSAPGQQNTVTNNGASLTALSNQAQQWGGGFSPATKIGNYNFNSFTASTNLYALLFDYNSGNNEIVLAGTLKDTVGGIQVVATATATLQYANSDFTVVTDEAIIDLVFDASGENYINLTATAIPCSQGKQTNPGGQLNGQFGFNLPAGIGEVTGNCTIQFTCSAGSIGHTLVSGQLGPLQFNVLGGFVLVDSASFTFDSATKVLNVAMQTQTSTLSVQYTFGNGGVLNSFSISTPGPISPFNASLPFSEFWTDVLGSQNVAVLNNDVLITNFSLAYTMTNVASFNLQGALQIDDFDASLNLVLTNSNGWVVTTANVVLEIDNFATVSIQGGSICTVGQVTAQVALNSFGPFSQGALLNGIANFACVNGSISSYTFNVSTSNLTLNVLGASESLSASVAYDSTLDQFQVVAATSSWGANVAVQNGSWSLDLATYQPLTFANLPFSSGFASTLPSPVNGLTLNNLVFQYGSGNLQFAAQVSEAMGSFNAGAGVLVLMNNNGTGWNLLSADISFDASFPIGSVGMANVNGNLACPTGLLNASVILSGIPEIPTVNADGTLTYQCQNGILQYYNASLTIASFQVTVGSEMVTLSGVSIQYSNFTDVLTVSGEVTFTSQSGSGVGMVINGVWIIGKKSSLQSLTITMAAGSVSLYDPNMPFANMVGGTVSSSGNSLVTPGAQLEELLIVYQPGPATLNIFAELVDGTFQGNLTLNLVNGTVSLAQVSVALDYGTIVVSGSSPCPNGWLNVNANLNLPVVGQQVIIGQAQFVCNDTQSISSYSLNLQDTMTFNAFGGSETLVANLAYSSSTKDLQVSALFGQNISLTVDYEPAPNKSYNLQFQVNSPTSFSSIPFAGQLTNTINSANATSTSLSGFTLQYAELSLVGGTGLVDTLYFTCDVEETIQSSSGLLDVVMQFTSPPNGNSWSLTFVDVNISLLVDNTAQITVQVEPLCPAANANVTVNLNNMPLDIPQVSLVGSIQFGCNGNKIDYSDYYLTASLDFATPLTLNFLGDTLQISGPSLTYNSSSDIFVLSWSPDTDFVMTLSWGNGLVTPGASTSFSLPFTFTAATTGQAPVGTVIGKIGKQMPSFAASTGGYVQPTGVKTGGSAVQSDVNSIVLESLEIAFSDVDASITIDANVNFYGLDTSFFLFANKQAANWNMLFGVTFDTTNGAANNFNSGYSWLDNIFGSGQSLQCENVYFAIATGAGIFTLQSGQQVQSFGPGLLIQGGLVIADGGKMQTITGGSTTSTSTSAKGGAMGASLAQNSQDGTTIDFLVDITPNQLNLIVSMSQTLQSSSANTTYQGISFEIQSTLAVPPQVTFEFVYTYIANLGTPTTFVGAMGLSFSDTGLAASVGLGFTGDWVDPLGLSSSISIQTILVSCDINLETLVPTMFDMEIAATINDPIDSATATLEGELLLDISTPTTNNAVMFSLNDCSLATIVNLFWTDMPSWLQSTMQSLSIGSSNFSFNPSATAASFSIGTIQSAPIPPGISINVQNLDFFGLIQVDTAYFASSGSTLSADLVLAPMVYGDIFSVSLSLDNTTAGPQGSFTLSPSQLLFDLQGAISLFGDVGVEVNVNVSVDPISGQTASTFFAEWEIYSDTVTISLIEQTGGYNGGPWSFGIQFEMDTTYSGGFFAAILDGWNSTIYNILTTLQTSITNYVNQQAAQAIQSANQALQSAIASLQQLQSEIDSELNSAESAVSSAQDTVNSWQSDCNNYNSECGWWHPWDCLAYAGCEVSLGIAEGALWATQQILTGIEDGVNDVIQGAEDAVQAAQDAVDAAIEAGTALVDGVVDAVFDVITSLVSDIASALGQIINLQSFMVSDTLSSGGQDTFAAEMVCGFFGSAPSQISFSFNVSSIWSTVEAMIASGAEDLANWVNSKLSGTPAASYSNNIYNALVSSSQSVAGGGSANVGGIGALGGSNTFYAGSTLINELGQSWLYSPSNTYGLVMQNDSNLVLYELSSGSAVWSSNTWQSGSPCPCQFQILENGNAIVTNQASGQVWSSNTVGSNATALILEDTGNFFLLTATSGIVWTNGDVTYNLLPGMSLLSSSSAYESGDGSMLWNGDYRLIMQGDGNLVIYGSNGAIWASETNSWPYLYSGPYALVNAGSGLSIYSGTTLISQWYANSPDAGDGTIFGGNLTLTLWPNGGLALTTLGYTVCNIYPANTPVCTMPS